MNEKENSVKHALESVLSCSNAAFAEIVRQLEARYWVHQPPAPPTAHWRDLPAGPALDEYVQATLYPEESPLLPWNYWTGAKAYKPRSTDLALAMGMLEPGEYVAPESDAGDWRIYIGGVLYAVARSLAHVPYEICRAKLAAHEAGR